MNKTLIDWVKNPNGTQGYTWNPITGCLNGCPYCYARKLANGRLKPLYLANNNLAPTIGEGVTPYNTSRLIDSLDPFYPRFWEDRVRELQRGIDEGDYERYIRQSAKGIFVCDMSDLFGIGIPEEWTSEVMATIGDDANSIHRFYLLTKQPQNLIKFSPFPDNCWVGVTATNREMFTEACSHLIGVKATVKFISLEPLLQRIIFTEPGEWGKPPYDWVIIGAQTKPYKPPKIEWVQEITKACDKAGVPVFLKDNLHPILSKQTATIFHRAYPDYCELRQEVPA